MNDTQKANIDALIKVAASMKTFSEKKSSIYHDEKIASFARAAIDDNKGTKEYIIKTIKENIPLFLNLKNLRIDNGSFSGHTWFRNENITTKIGRFLEIFFKLHPAMYLPVKNGNAGGLYAAREILPEEIEITNVFAHTSNTDLPEYRVCSVWSLTSHCPHDYDFGGKYDSSTWNYIYGLALATQRQTKLLVTSFEEAIKSRYGVFKATAEKYENAKNINAEIGVYVKVERMI